MVMLVTENELLSAAINSEGRLTFTRENGDIIDAGIAVGPAVTDADMATIAADAGSAFAGQLSATFARTQGRPINAYDHGVVPGATPINGALNSLIDNNPGATIRLAPATYLSIADAGVPSVGKGGGIMMHRPGVTLDLTGARIEMAPSSSQHYQIIDIDAPDCRVVGGSLIGDVGTHTGAGGEWGYAISVGAAGHRFVAEGVYASKCWGDGFFVWERPEDVLLLECTADDNRRQGASIIDAIRPRISGGVYKNTGLTAYTGPGAGIDLEPDTGTSRDVIDAVLTGVVMDGNRGAGLLLSGTDRTLTATVTGGRSTNNLGAGYRAEGNASAEVVGLTARGNAASGFMIFGTVTLPSRYVGVVAVGNGERGILVAGDRQEFVGPVAEGNQLQGIYTQAVADSTTVTGGVSRGNGLVAHNVHPQVDNEGTNTRITGHVSDAGSAANKPSYGFVNRASGAGFRLLSSDTRGTFPGGNYLDQSGTAVAFPTPGVAKQSGTPAAAVDPATTMALANNLRTKLLALGLISS